MTSAHVNNQEKYLDPEKFFANILFWQKQLNGDPHINEGVSVIIYT